MPEWVMMVLFQIGVCFFAGITLAFFSYRAYKGRWSWFLTNQPFMVPVGRYWGLLTCALWAVCSFWVGVAGSYIVWFNYYHVDMSTMGSFLLTVPVIVIVGGAGTLFSWWLPKRWRPQWLLDLDRQYGGSQNTPYEFPH